MSQNQKNVLVSFLVTVAVVAFAFLVFGRKSSTQPAQVGLTQSDLGQFPEGVKNGDQFERWFSKTLPAGENDVPLYTNRTGRDVLVSFGSVNVLTGQVASSSYDVYVLSTTSSATAIPVANDFATQGGTAGKQQLIRGITLATTTTATTTSSVYAAAVNKGNGAILVPDGSTVFGYMVQTYPLGPGGACNGATCESSTSTNRGFNPVFNIKVYAPQAF